MDLGQPWTLKPRTGKHYGTVIVDRDGDHVMTIWSTGKHESDHQQPSEREQAYFGDYTPERWAKYCSDSHYECQRDLDRALEVIRIINASADQSAQ